MNLYILFLIANIINYITATVVNNLPTIAILATPIPLDTDDAQESRINYQYVRWLDQSLARTVVIQPWFNKDQIDDVLSKVDAIIFPGGDRNLHLGGQLENVASYILNQVIEFKDKYNRNLTLWGTCLGFEMLHILIANTTDALGYYNAEQVESKLIINKAELSKSKMYNEFTKEDIEKIESMNLLAEFHQRGEGFEEYSKYLKLKEFFTITALGKDLDNKIYINSVEAKNYSIYGVQYHPEMIGYTNVERKGVPDTIEAVRIAQIIGNFLVKQARENKNTFKHDLMNEDEYINSFQSSPVNEEDWYYYKFKKPSLKKSVTEF